MANKRNPVYYKRDRNKVEIKGDHRVVRWIIAFDLISHKLLWVILLLLLVIAVPQMSWLPAILKWFK